MERNVLRSKKVEQLSEVVDETGDLHPFRLTVPPDGLGSLKEVLDLGEVRLQPTKRSVTEK
jgi:hypothetical protein